MSARPVKPRLHKYSTLPKFGFIVQAKHPGLRQGRIAIVTNRRPGSDGRDGVGRKAHCRAGNREQWLSRLRHGADSVFAWLRERAHATPRSDMRRRARTEKSCGPDARGLCVKSCSDVTARPGARISHRQGDGGNSASLPGESTKDTVKTIRAGKAGRSGEPVVHPVCIFCGARTCGCQPAPGLPCALVSMRACETQSSGDIRRENAMVRLPFETCSRAMTCLASLLVSSPGLTGRSSTPRRALCEPIGAAEYWMPRLRGA